MAGKNVVGPLFGFLTLIFCFVTIASLFLKAWLAFTIFLILCLISLAIFARLHFKEFVHFFVSRQLRYGANVALGILGVIGIAVFVNVIVAQRFDKRVDLTELRLYSLSEQTKQILKKLDKKVDIIAFFSNEIPQLAAPAKEMLGLYQRESELINVSFKNPNIETALTQKYDLKFDGTIVFESKDRVEKVTIVDEQKFTSALLKIIQNKTKKVYFLSGHGEHGIGDTTNNRYRQVRTELEKQNYEVLSHSLLKEPKIPEDCDVLVVAGPTKPIGPQGIDTIEKYLAKNGKLLLLLDPSLNSTEDVNHGLVQLMEKWGVKIGNDLVYDRVNFYLLLGGHNALHLQFEPHDITRYFFQEQIPFIFCRSVTLSDDIPNHLTVKPIAKTRGPKGISWAETEREAEGTFSSDGYTAGVDIPGPVSIAVAVDQKIDENTEKKEASASTRIVVFGDSDFATDTHFATGNPDIPAYAPLLPSIINWLTLDEDLIGIVPPDPNEQNLREMNAHQVRLVQITSIFLIPLIIFIAGMIVWWRRREGGTA